MYIYWKSSPHPKPPVPELAPDHPLGFATISQVHQGIVRIHVLAATAWLFHMGFSMAPCSEKGKDATKLP